MKVLILGGTGSMGKPLVSILSSNHNNQIYVSTRGNYTNTSNIFYLKGNAHDTLFLKQILSTYYDVIIDFMYYDSKEFEKRIDLLLSSTAQYFCISSARVYSDNQQPITENSPRLIDTIKDSIYLQGNDYSIEKCRTENILQQSKRKNWTIIWPYITYNDNRLQLGIYELHDWYYRFCKSRTIPISKNIASATTTLTYGYDVAKGINALIGRKEALGETYHITSPIAITWKEIIEIYDKTILKITGHNIKYQITKDDIFSHFGIIEPQIIYDRNYTRIFNNTKIGEYINVRAFTSPQNGIQQCIESYINNKETICNINWYRQALMDRITGEQATREEFASENEWNFYKSIRFPNFKHKIKIFLYNITGKKIL